MKSIIKYLLSFFILLLSLVNVAIANVPRADAYQVVQNLEEQWMVYDSEYKGYVPFLKEMHGNPSALYLELNLDSYKGYFLQVSHTQGGYLFIQAQLYKKIASQEQIRLSIDSLKNLQQKSAILISLYNASGHTTMPSVAMVRKVTASKDISLAEQSDVTPLKPATRSGLGDFIILSALLIVTLYAFLWNYHPKAFNSYYSL